METTPQSDHIAITAITVTLIIEIHLGWFPYDCILIRCWTNISIILAIVIIEGPGV